MTWGYDANVIRPLKLVSLASLEEHSQNLYTTLRNVRTEVPPERPIVFIAHSLGGMVTKDALLQSQRSTQEAVKAISNHTCGVVFMGTLHFGSADANVGYFFAYLFGMAHQSNISPLEDLERDGPRLNTLERSFSQLLAQRLAEQNPVEVACFCESLPVGGVLGIAKGTQELVNQQTSAQ